MSRLGRTTVACQQWVELVTDYLDGALPRRLVRAIDRHLAGCEHCREYLDQMRRTIALTGAMGVDDVPDDVIGALAAALAEERARHAD